MEIYEGKLLSSKEKASVLLYFIGASKVMKLRENCR